MTGFVTSVQEILIFMRTIFLNIIRSSLKYIKMSSKPKESRIKENMVAVNQTMTELKSEVSTKYLNNDQKI